MNTSVRGWRIRARRAALRYVCPIIAVVSVQFVNANATNAQSCPPSPTSYTYGSLTVREGLLTSGSGDVGLGGVPSVGMDKPATGPAHVIAALETGKSNLTAGYTEIVLVGLTGPNDPIPGTCIKGPKVISTPDPQSAAGTSHMAPSIAMTAGGLFRTGWWATVKPCDLGT